MTGPPGGAGREPAGDSRGSGARKDRWSLRLAAIALGLLAAFAVGEIATRGIDYARGLGSARRAFEGNIFEFCTSRHHRLLPDGVHRHASAEFDYLWRNNSLGMRDRERRLAKAAGAFRILVLGDSVIQGHGVALEDTMTMRLEASLQAADPGRPVEVMNAGVFGYSPLLESLYLREIMEPTDPDLVLVGFFLGNDVGEDHFYAGKARFLPDGRTVAFSDQEWPWSLIEAALDGVSVAALDGATNGPPGWRVWPALRQVARQSHLLSMVKTAIDARGYSFRREREFALVRQRRGDIAYDLGLVNYDVLGADQRRAYWNVTLGYLEEIEAQCRAHGVPMVLLVIPPAERLLGMTRFEEPYQILAQEGLRLGVPVILPFAGLDGVDANSIYFKYDRHWTPEGHRLAAAFVETELRRLHLLPAGGAP